VKHIKNPNGGVILYEAMVTAVYDQKIRAGQLEQIYFRGGGGRHGRFRFYRTDMALSACVGSADTVPVPHVIQKRGEARSGKRGLSPAVRKNRKASQKSKEQISAKENASLL